MDLSDYRKEIDAVDRKLVELFIRRMEIASSIAEYKREHGIQILDSSREQEKLDAVSRQAGEAMAPYIRELFSRTMEVSRNYQSGIMERRE